MTDTKVTPYQLMGGEAAILSLVDRFYFFMDSMPEAAELRAIHAPSLANARSKLFKFLSGWLGGPGLFEQEFGHPRLRQRHFPFAIGPAERDQWMMCMNRALGEMPMDSELRQAIAEAMQNLATHMINQ